MGYAKLDLNGKSAVVIGGTSGIGRAIALGLAEAGADVVASSRRRSEVESVTAEIEEMGRQSLSICSDVLDRDSLQRLYDQTLAAFGKIDILVNAAGMTKRVATLECTEEDWCRILE